MEDILITRHAIYNRDLKAIGYKLLCGSSKDIHRQQMNGHQPLSAHLISALVDSDLDELIHGSKGFIEINKKYLDQKYLNALLTKPVIFCIANDVLSESKYFDELVKLSVFNARLCVQNFPGNDSLMPIMDAIQFAIFDVEQYSDEELQHQIDFYRQFNVSVIANHVVNYPQFERLRQLSFDAFSGDFFSTMNTSVQQVAPANKLICMELLSELQDPEVDFRDIEESLAKDVTLSYRLFRFVNSAALGLSGKIGSLREAVIMVGLEKLKSLVSILALASVLNKSVELMLISLIRAKMAEQLAMNLENADPAPFFTAGLFSLLEAFFDKPLADLLNQIPITDNMRQALLQHQGLVGKILYDIKAYERGEWNNIDTQKISLDCYRQAYLTGLKWAQEVMVSLS